MYCIVLPDFYSILQHINIQLLSLLSSSSWFVHMISVIESNSLHASCVCVCIRGGGGVGDSVLLSVEGVRV